MNFTMLCKYFKYHHVVQLFVFSDVHTDWWMNGQMEGVSDGQSNLDAWDPSDLKRSVFRSAD